MATRLRIDIVGPRPSEVDIEDLATILDDLKKAVAGCLLANKDAPEPAARISLVDVVEGSDGLVFEVQPQAAAAISTLSRALRSRSYGDLPSASHSALYRINQFTAKRAWGIRIRAKKSVGVEPVEVIEPDHVDPPTNRRTLSGSTNLLGRCLRVGGATTPRAELRLTNERLLYVEVTENVARELGKRLYDQVVLGGEAVWDAKDGELQEFKVKEVTTFRAVPVNIAFKELASASRGRWDNVDAESFVKRVRESSE
jgi:hypothetical protein